MAAGREQRTVFGEVAQTYHDVRPGYPEALFDDLVAFMGQATARAVEVGAGTGKATVAIAARGISVLALEPSPAMADVARRTCCSFPDVSMVVSTFEEWPLPAGEGFDLVFSAQAWHWVDRSIAYAKAYEALRPRGAFAVFWNRPTWEECDLRGELDEIYSRLAPELHARAPGFPALKDPELNPKPAREIRDSGLFEDPDVRKYRWSCSYTSRDYTRLLSTQSDHRMLAAPVRESLFEAVRDLADRHGGQLTLDYATTLFVTRRRD